MNHRRRTARIIAFGVPTVLVIGGGSIVAQAQVAPAPVPATLHQWAPSPATALPAPPASSPGNSVSDAVDNEMATDNAVQAALADRLTGAGIENELVTEPDGSIWVDYDDSTATVSVLVDQFYRERYAPTRGEVTDLNDEADALAIFLAHVGVPFRVVTDGSGVRDVLPTPDDQRAEDAIDDFYWTADPPSKGELEDQSDETTALDAYLTQAGVVHELVTDRHGVTAVSYDEKDDQVNAVVDTFYENHPEFDRGDDGE